MEYEIGVRLDRIMFLLEELNKKIDAIVEGVENDGTRTRQ